MAVNDLFLLFTDGLFEVNSPGGEEYGLDRLMNALRSHAGLPTEALLDELLKQARAFAGTVEFEDDVCLVAMDVQQVEIQRSAQ